MSTAIKVHDSVKQELDELAGPGETYNDTIDQLLVARRRLLETLNTLEPYLKINKWREDRLRQLAAAPPPPPAADRGTVKK